MAPSPIYSVDTSSLVAAWAERYPIDNFPTFWQKFEEAAEAGLVVASMEVFHELEKRADDCHEWFKDRPEMFVEIDDEVQSAVAGLMGKYPKLVDTRRGKSGADPFVIALASTSSLGVVTEERGGTLQRPKIPFVCASEGVDCVNLLDFIKERGWSF
ncbi:MAG: DUF4411 family protein [Alphaproteobacteria bacterium]|nr:DUF4411 family protein [Alphaproteobacteria bacterium]